MGVFGTPTPNVSDSVLKQASGGTKPDPLVTCTTKLH